MRKFVMTQIGWDEARASSAASQGTPRAWTMIPQLDGLRRGAQARLAIEQKAGIARP